MVKIDNTLGDVKIGRQGEVVYQRKYGQQIRRLAAPKRAIPSQVQLSHRELYKTALAWRSELSLPNRRYLDGYPIANWIVDKYKIPLTWSRFALKLYLEKVRFTLSEVYTAPPEHTEQKYQSYEIAGNSNAGIIPPYPTGQTFTPEVKHGLSRVYIKAYRVGNPPPIKVSIWKCGGDHKPTGSELCLVWHDFSDLTEALALEWYYIDLPAITVIAGQEYAITVNNLNGDGDNHIRWELEKTTPLYARGVKILSGDDGLTWLLQTDKDHLFQEWYIWDKPATKCGLLHVTHPALLSVIHKRGGVPLLELDGLSSLDEEYLTGTVGLDVQAGDYIEAESFTGAQSSFVVS